MILLKNVTKRFDGPKGKVTALDDVSFSLPSREMLVINGPSGCGKSTLLLTAAGMLRPDHGDVQIMDKYHPYALPPEQRSRLRADTVLSFNSFT
jgi:ABC-type sugar transport system ATPase subunit